MNESAYKIISIYILDLVMICVDSCNLELDCFMTCRGFRPCISFQYVDFLAHDALLAHSRQEPVGFRSPFTGVKDPVPLTILKVLPLWLCRDRTVEATKELLHHVSQPTHSSGALVGRNRSCFDAKTLKN